MKIGIDARFLTHPQNGGFKTYSENLIAALAEIDSDNEYILYLDRSPDQNARLPDRANFQTRIITVKFPLIGMPWREQISLSRQIKRDKLDLFHSPCMTAPLHLGCASVVTIHDMIWLFPDKFSAEQRRPISLQRKLMGWYYQFIPQIAARQAAAVITVSNASKESIVRWLGLSPDRIFVTYEAANPIYHQIKSRDTVAAIRKKYKLDSNFILAIGSADPRKNIEMLIRAYRLLPQAIQDKYQLVIIWTHNILTSYIAQMVKALGLKDRICFLENVCDDDMVALYNASELFVFPSRYEGFGLPIVEAMACGTVVVAANNSSIPEIAGDAAIFTDSDDDKDLAEGITKVLIDDVLRTELVAKGLKRVEGFNWTKCGYETLKAYENAFFYFTG